MDMMDLTLDLDDLVDPVTLTIPLSDAQSGHVDSVGHVYILKRSRRVLMVWMIFKEQDCLHRISRNWSQVATSDIMKVQQF
jgi:hypothetical protein